MSDFFANLAARAQTSETAIRPRLTGRFEPVAPTAQLADVTVETEADGAVIAPLPNAQPSLTTKPAPTTDRQAAPDTLTTAPDKPPAPIGNPTMRPQSAAVADPPPYRPALPPTRETIVTADHPVPAPSDVAIPPRTHVSHPAASESLPRATEKNVVAPQIVHAAAPATIAAQSAPPQTATLSIPAEPVAPNLLPPRTNLLPDVPTRRRERDKAPDRPPISSAEPETVVHVSIGRIELRVPTPPARNREKPSSPVTPLSEYLRQRAAKAGG